MTAYVYRGRGTLAATEATLRFRAMWPVLDGLIDPQDLITQATRELPQVAARAQATLTSPPRWAIREGRDIPGSGGHQWVLVAEAAAVNRVRPTGDL